LEIPQLEMSDFVFIYWDDPGDSQKYVDNQKKNEVEAHDSESCPQYQRTQEEEEDDAERRMMIIMRNGNEGLHYEIYDDDEYQDVE